MPGKRGPWVSGRGSPDAGGLGGARPFRVQVQGGKALGASNPRRVGLGRGAGTPIVVGAGARKPRPDEALDEHGGLAAAGARVEQQVALTALDRPQLLFGELHDHH